MKTCPKCKKKFNPDKVIRIYDKINSEWIKMTAGDWTTGACSRKCHYKMNMEHYDKHGDPVVEGDF